MEGFRDLVAWQLAMELLAEVYALARRLPKEETFGLASQMRRAALSIPSNIAEGAGRNSKKEMRVFLGHARGSVCELETQFEACVLLKYATAVEIGPMLLKAQRVGRLINGLRQWSEGKRARGAAGE